VLETKPFGLGLHYRLAPHVERQARALAQRLADQLGLKLQLGHMLAEVRTPGPDKGDAVAAFMAEPPFDQSRPVMVGDDLTDEDAFAWVERTGGVAVHVGEPRATAASRRLPTVAAVLDWLEASLTARSST
jgi:trehalose 6-phosphate phosphatase